MTSLFGAVDPMIDDLLEIKTEDIYEHDRPLTTLNVDKTSDLPNLEEPTNTKIKEEIVYKNESMDTFEENGDIISSCCQADDMSLNDILTFKRENSFSSNNDPGVRECSVVLIRAPMQEILQCQNRGTCSKDEDAANYDHLEEHTDTQIKEEIKSENERMDADSLQGNSDILSSQADEISPNDIPLFKRENSSSSNNEATQNESGMSSKPQTTHRKSSGQHRGILAGKKKYACDVSYCKFRASELIQLVIHLRSHASNSTHKTYFCEFCDFKTKSCRELVDHTKDEHPGKDLPFSCSICKYCAGDNRRLLVHMRKHKDEKAIKCTKCDFVTSCDRNLRNHLSRVHSVQLPARIWNCRYCPFSAAKIKEFGLHTLTQHPGEDFFKCKRCDYVSYSARSIEEHKWKHVGGKPFKCDICATGFTYNKGLQRHIKAVH